VLVFKIYASEVRYWWSECWANYAIWIV